MWLLIKGVNVERWPPAYAGIDYTHRAFTRAGQRDGLILGIAGNRSMNGPHLMAQVRAGLRSNDAFASIRRRRIEAAKFLP